MGIRIEFYQNTTSLPLRELLDAEYESFKKDYVAAQSIELKKHGLDTDDVAIFGFLSIDLATKVDFEGLDGNLLDTLAFAFFQFRYEYFIELGASLYKKHYEESSGIVNATRDAELKNFWDILLYGRSIARGALVAPPITVKYSAMYPQMNNRACGKKSSSTSATSIWKDTLPAPAYRAS